jgi:hypothetical protein
MDFFPFEAPYVGLLVMFNVTHHPRTPLLIKKMHVNWELLPNVKLHNMGRC